MVINNKKKTHKLIGSPKIVIKRKDNINTQRTDITTSNVIQTITN